MRMGHVNSTQGNEERRVSQPTTSFDFETDANIVHNGILNTEKYLPKLDVITLDSNIALTDVLCNGDTVSPGANGEVHSVEDLDLGSGESNEDLGLGVGEEFDLDEQWTRTIPTVFHWDRGGQEVFLAGSFSEWNARIPMNSSHGEFETIIELPEGEHEFKYLVDGKWVHDPNIPTTNDMFGGRNNVVSIKKSDFEVMSALNSDDKRLAQIAISPTSTEGSYGQLIPSHHTPMVVKEKGVHSSVPPAVPPHLLNVNLNKRVPNVNEPSLLHEPNHVSVNHLYALSIKDGVMVVSSCIRYRKKFITTLLYRPVTMPRR